MPRLVNNYIGHVLTKRLSAVGSLAFALLVLVAVGCKSFNQKNEVSNRIDAFQYDRFDMIMLGVPQTLGTENTVFVLAHPNEAKQPLVHALNDQKHLRKVGFAAYCLRGMKYRGGLSAAKKAFEKLNRNGKPHSADEVFARNELRLYIQSLDVENP